MNVSEILAIVKCPLLSEDFFRQRGMLTDSAPCLYCESPMRLFLNTDNDHNDYYMFKCVREGCEYSVNIRENTIFVGIRRPFRDLLLDIFEWAMFQNKSIKAELASLGKGMQYYWKKKFDKICQIKYNKNLEKKIGGSSSIVHVDTSHTIGVSNGRNFETVRLVGAYQLEQNDFQCFVHIVPDMDCASIANFLSSTIKQGTTLIIDFEEYVDFLEIVGFRVENYIKSCENCYFSSEKNFAKEMCNKFVKLCGKTKTWTLENLRNQTPEKVFFSVSLDPFEDILRLIKEIGFPAYD